LLLSRSSFLFVRWFMVQKQVVYEQMTKVNYESAINRDECERLKQVNAKLRTDMESMTKEHKKADVVRLYLQKLLPTYTCS
jgi:hypothetical protein